MINNTTLMGRLTADPELRATNKGTNVTRFTVAVDKAPRDGERPQANFINIVAWRKTAEFVCRYFRKGSMIGIVGAIDTNRYEDRDGNKRTSFEVIAREVHFCGSKAESGQNNENKQQGKQAPQNAQNARKNTQDAQRNARYSDSRDDYNDYFYSDEEPPYGY